MRKLLLGFALMLVSITSTMAQQKYWAYFTDKANVDYSALNYLTAEAIWRRSMNGFPIEHEEDKPVNLFYIQSVSHLADSLGWSSRWLNAQAFYGDENQAELIRSLPFVKRVSAMQSHGVLAESKNQNAFAGEDEFERLQRRQIQVMQGDTFIARSINGEGVKVAIFDAGFPSVDYHEAFEHIRSNERIIKTFDFVKNRPYVYAKHSHGTMVLSNVAGMHNDYPLGVATGATFLLARTEGPGEVKSEEDRWIAALEWAEALGVKVVNSSLGYGYHRYMEEDMDGKTSPIARAANKGAKRGVLIVNSAGNEGTDFWETIVTPADADSVLAVGGVDPNINIHIDFGSYGPTADKRMKPNVSHYAEAVVADPKGTITTAYGTSFSSPLTTGFAACVAQMHPDWSAMELFKEIEKSAHLYPYYDYAHGFGIPQATYFTNEAEEPVVTFEAILETDSITITAYDYRDLNLKANSFIGLNHMYVHVENENGFLNKYWVVRMEPLQSFTLTLEEMDTRIEDPTRIRIYLNGYTQEIDL